jgi:hypothetical protein
LARKKYINVAKVTAKATGTLIPNKASIKSEAIKTDILM